MARGNPRWGAMRFRSAAKIDGSVFAERISLTA